MSNSSQPHVIPPPESFPPPGTPSSRSPSSHSSGTKRKRDASVTASTRFTDATRNQLFLLYGNECWLCSANTRLDNCHVIGQKDRGFFLYRQAGLIAFESLADVQNAVTLCPTCHREFDDTQCPGFIFFPSDLQFFIDFERQDYERRGRWARDGYDTPTRVCPSAGQYETGRSPLYNRIVLQNYLPRLGSETSDMTGLLPPRSWHGSPMAALMRAFLILGSPVLAGAIPQEQRALLRELQDLYLRPSPVRQSAESSATITPGHTTVITSESERASTLAQNAQLNPTHMSQQEQESSGPRGCDSAVDVGITRRRSGIDHDERTRKRLRDELESTQDGWSWGPASSSQDKATWLPRMMGHTAVG